MSIYRRTDRVPQNDFQPEPDPRPAGFAPDTRADWTKRRMSEPANGLLKPTFTWASTLPLDIQPRTLLYKFPRIANLMAAMWQDPNSLRRYVDDLLVDKRGNRQGFPLEVLRELFKLRAYYDELHPGDAMPWDMVDKKE
jgi:hypothetical protein